MKLLYLLLCFPITLFGQNHQSILSKSILECQYKCVQQKTEDTFVLKCGKDISQFYNPTMVRLDSLRESNFDLYIESMAKNIEGRKASGVSTRSIIYNESLYRNYPVKGKLSLYSLQSQANLVYFEDIPNFDWSINEDSTSTVLGYKCHFATTEFRGRKWIAWFTEDIPISCGPWKLSGLPGLILKAYTTDGFILFEAQNITCPENENIVFYNYQNLKFKSITRDEYLNFKKRPRIIPFANKVLSPKPYIELK